MEAKKTTKADLESKRGVMLTLGFIVALAAVLMAFEWVGAENTGYDLSEKGNSVIIDETVIQRTKTDLPKQEIKLRPSITRLNIVDDITDIDDIFDPDDIEDPSTYVITKVTVAEEKPIDDDTIFIVVESPPEFIGGEEALYKFLGENTVYPEVAMKAGITGIAYIAFVVEKDGSITNVMAERGPAGGCTEEALRVVKMMPNWKPGVQRTRKVRVRFVLPIHFDLQ